MMTDIKVRDSEYTQAAHALGAICEKLTGCMDEYCAALAYVKANAIRDRLISDALDDISTKVLDIRAIIEAATASLQNECNSYVSQIDEADTYLY